MGQYYIPVSIDSEEYLDAHDLHAGLKALEIASTNIPQLVQYLLTQTTGAGGGDFKVSDEPEFFGRWAGDRVAFVGDYDDTALGLTDEEAAIAAEYRDQPYSETDWEEFVDAHDQPYTNLYKKARERFANISEPAMAEYNRAVDRDDYRLRPRMYERDATFDVVGTHPDVPKTLATDVTYQEAGDAFTAYAREYGREYIEFHERE
jgi:hypothetical protein